MDTCFRALGSNLQICIQGKHETAEAWTRDIGWFSTLPSDIQKMKIEEGEPPEKRAVLGASSEYDYNSDSRPDNTAQSQKDAVLPYSTTVSTIPPASASQPSSPPPLLPFNAPASPSWPTHTPPLRSAASPPHCPARFALSAPALPRSEYSGLHGQPV